MNQIREQEHDQYLAEMSSQSEEDYDEDEEYADGEEYDDDEDAGVNHQEVDDDEEEAAVELEEDMDDEAKHLYHEQHNEADILMTKAKKLRAGAEKLRGFYKNGVSNGDRKKGTKPYKTKSPCSKCGQRGHSIQWTSNQ